MTRRDLECGPWHYHVADDVKPREERCSKQYAVNNKLEEDICVHSLNTFYKNEHNWVNSHNYQSLYDIKYSRKLEISSESNSSQTADPSIVHATYSTIVRAILSNQNETSPYLVSIKYFAQKHLNFTTTT